MENKKLKTLEEIREIVKEELNPGIQIVTPQFERLDELEIEWTPKTLEEFEGLCELPIEVLHKMGCGKWDDYNSVVKENKVSKFLRDESSPTENSEVEKWIILYPGEWFDYIPEGLEVIGLYGEKEKFEREKADDDIRFGCLSYGFLKEK